MQACFECMLQGCACNVCETGRLHNMGVKNVQPLAMGSYVLLYIAVHVSFGREGKEDEGSQTTLRKGLQSLLVMCGARRKQLITVHILAPACCELHSEVPGMEEYHGQEGAGSGKCC